MKNLLVIGVFVLGSVQAHAGYALVPLSKSSLRSKGCEDITQKFCRDKQNNCVGVYVATEKASQKCKSITPNNIELVCGIKTAHLFDTSKSCVLEEAPKPISPKSVETLTQNDVNKIYLYTDLHKEICSKICGVRYDGIDVRNFIQTSSKPGLLCIDDSVDEKNGMKLSEDEIRMNCTEKHRANDSWCVTYDRVFNHVSYGAFLQCMGKISSFAKKEDLACKVDSDCTEVEIDCCLVKPVNKLSAPKYSQDLGEKCAGVRCATSPPIGCIENQCAFTKKPWGE